MAIKYLPGWRWRYVKNAQGKVVDRYGIDPSGRIYTVRQTQNIQRKLAAEAGQPKAPTQPRVGRRYTRERFSAIHGRVIEIYYDTLAEAQERFQAMYTARDPRIMPYEIWYIQVIYTAMVKQRDTNTAKQVPRYETVTENGQKHRKRITQERAALSPGYERLERMGETDEPWDDARLREDNFTVRRIVLFGAER